MGDIEPRCAICGWALAESVEKGCVVGNCSQRPWPGRFYDPERADREYGHVVSDKQLPLPAIELECQRLREQYVRTTAALRQLIDAVETSHQPFFWDKTIKQALERGHAELPT